MLPSAEDILGSLRRGALEFCILGALERNQAYGYELTRILEDAGPLIGGEGTMYPLLARLRRSGWVTTSWQESTTGPPRRYYQLTTAGRDALAVFRGIWPTFVGAVNSLTEGE